MYLFNRFYWLSAFASVPSAIAAIYDDYTSSGNYQILGCGAGQPNSQASKLQAILPHVYNNLQPVIADVALGTSSTHGYWAFFKDNRNIANIKTIFQNMAAGSPVQVSSEGRDINPLSIRWPTFVCINPGVPEVAGFYATCTQGAMGGNIPMAHHVNSELIGICPLFWELADRVGEAPSISDCPRVRRNTLTPNTNNLAVQQQGQIVHELAHLYGVGSEPGAWLEGEYEIYNVNDAVNLDEADSLVNAQNYALYYGSVVAGCTRWPNMDRPHDQILLEVDNSTNSTLTILPPSSNNTVLATIPNPNSTQPVDIEIPSSVPIPPTLDIAQGACQDAVQAPNATVCCNTDTGMWVPTPVRKRGLENSSANPACLANPGGSGGSGAGRKRRW